MPPHGDEAASGWVLRFAPLVPAGARVLDLAAGSGRHTRVFAARGCRVVAVDREPRLDAALRAQPGVEVRALDLEAGDWPLAGERFDAVVVTRYLHRPLFPHLRAALAPGGLLLYETFASGNAQFGKPSNPAFLLAPRELLDVFGDSLRVIAFEDGYVDAPRPAMLQRLAARRRPADGELQPRAVALQPPGGPA